MSNQHTVVPQDHRVSIKYDDGAHSFRLAPGTTLGELAVRIGGLDGLHDRGALLIEIVLNTHNLSEASAIVASATSH